VSGALPVLPPPTVHCVHVGLAGQHAYMQGCEAWGIAVAVVWKACEMCSANNCRRVLVHACVCSNEARKGHQVCTACALVAAVDLVKRRRGVLPCWRYGTVRRRGVCAVPPPHSRGRGLCTARVECTAPHGPPCWLVNPHGGWSTAVKRQGAKGGEGEVGRSAGCNQRAHGTS
jgi:hypothetical protein